MRVRFYGVAFNRNGRTLASGSGDNTVRLWDVAAGTLSHTLEDHADQVYVTASSPDEPTPATAVDFDVSTIRLWEPAAGTLPENPTDRGWNVFRMVFSSDGRILASGRLDGSVHLWTVGAEVSRDIPGDNADGQAPTSGDSANPDVLRHTLEDHADRVFEVVFSPDGRILASGDADGTVHLWDVATGTLLYTLNGHGREVHSMVFSPDGQTLAGGDADGTVHLWDMVTGLLLHTLEGHGWEARSMAFSPDGQILASGGADGTVRLWDAVAGTLHHTLEGHGRDIHGVAFGPDGQTLASGGEDGIVRLWDAAAGTLLHTLEGHANRVYSVAFSPDGRLLASGSLDGTVRLWTMVAEASRHAPENQVDEQDPTSGSVAAGVLRHTLENSDWILSVSFSPDGHTVASGSRNGTVHLWDAAANILALPHTLEAEDNVEDDVEIPAAHTFTLRHTLTGHGGDVRSVAFSPDGRTLASGGFDNTVHIWDVAAGTLRHHAGRPYGLCPPCDIQSRRAHSGQCRPGQGLSPLGCSRAHPAANIGGPCGLGHQCGVQSRWTHSGQWRTRPHGAPLGCGHGHPAAHPGRPF